MRPLVKRAPRAACDEPDLLRIREEWQLLRACPELSTAGLKDHPAIPLLVFHTNDRSRDTSARAMRNGNPVRCMVPDRAGDRYRKMRRMPQCPLNIPRAPVAFPEQYNPVPGGSEPGAGACPFSGRHAASLA